MNDLERETLALQQRLKSLSSSSVEKPTLVYFDIVGIAWPIRVMLHLRDIDYELIRISLPQWAQTDANGKSLLKACFTNGHLPLYVDSEVELNQSALVIEYLADRYGFLPSAGVERTMALEVMGQAYDALFHWNGMLPVNIRIGMSDEEAQKRLAAFMGEGVYGLSTDGFRLNLNAFQRYLAKSESEYFVGDSLTAADLQSFNVLRNWYKAFAPDVFQSEYPRLDGFVRHIEGLPEIRAYIENSQEPTTWFQWPQAALRLTDAEELRAIKA